MLGLREFDFPRGLKPNVYGTRSGTAKAVPFQITFMRPVLVWAPLFQRDEAFYLAFRGSPGASISSRNCCQSSSEMDMKVDTTSGSNWRPEYFWISRRAAEM